MVSVNKLAVRLVGELIDRSEELGVEVVRVAGATVIDAGVKARGGLEAGRLIAEASMGGLGKCRLGVTVIGGVALPCVTVSTDRPGLACMASQYAGWAIKVGKFFAMGSGPARALALKPKELYEELGYRDESDEAVILLETGKIPGEEVVKYICEATGVKPEGLYIVVTPTQSLAGSVQISARIVETGIHKMHTLGLPLRSVLSGIGTAPVAPPHPDFVEAMGRTNDTQLYMGDTYYLVTYESLEELKRIVEETPSCKARCYGKPFADVFREAGYDFYKIDPALFAPARVTVTHVETGTTITAGRLGPEVFLKSIGVKG